MAVFQVVLALVAVVVTAAVVRSYLKGRWRRREARKRGCLPPPTVPSRGLFGINTLRESIRATKEERGVQWIANEMNLVGEDVHTVRADIFDYELILTRDTENVKALLATQSHDFDIGPHREKTFKSIFGLGVMTARGQKWKHSRGLIRPQFAREQLMKMQLFESHVQALLRKLDVDACGWTRQVDLSPLFYNLTLDVSTEFLVGQSVHSQSPDIQAKLLVNDDPRAPSLAAFGASLDKAKGILDRRGALAKYGWLVRSNEFDSLCKTVRSFVSYFVSRELEQRSMEKSDSAASDKFVLLHELAEVTQDPVTLQNEVLNVLHAARDTTASLLGWVFYFLARHPDVFHKVRQEILQAFPTGARDEITFRKIWDSHYLLQVVNETIRYVGIVPMNERAAVTDTTLPRGGGPDGKSPVFVAKGTQVLIPTYAMQHRKDIWGPDVEEFKPERWQHRKFGWDFVPFGGGARQCIGQQFARTEAMYTVIRFLQTFDQIENMEPPDSPIRFHHSIENRSGSGVQRSTFGSSSSDSHVVAIPTKTMVTRRSDSYDDSAIDPEKLAGIRHDATHNRTRSTPQKYSEEVTALPNNFPVSIPYSSVQTATQSIPTAPPARRPFFTRVKTEYILLSKKKKVGILVGIVALLVLIIGLAAGLSTRSHRSSNLPLPNNHGGPYTGDLTYYAPALGSCGITSTSEESIVAVSHLLYDAVSTGSNPNANPLCGKKIRARRNGKSVDLTVVDRCVGCKAVDLDVTESVFRELANIDEGRVTVEWAWLEDVPSGTIPSATPSSTTSTTTTAANSTVPTSTVTSTTVESTTTVPTTTSTPPPATTTTESTSTVPSTTVPSNTPTETPSPAPSSTPTSGTDVPASPSASGAPSTSGGLTTTVAPAPTTTP